MSVKMQAAFYKGKKRLFNRLTSWWLRGPYSHCELILATDDKGRSVCASASFLDGGVRIKHMHLNPDHWDIIEVGGDVHDAWNWLSHHLGEGYDLLGFVGFIARVLGHDKRRWFCSEAVAEMLGIPDAWRFDPCILSAALTRQPAAAGFFTPDGTTTER